MVEQEVAKDAEIKGFLTEIERAQAYLANLRKIAGSAPTSSRKTPRRWQSSKD